MKKNLAKWSLILLSISLLGCSSNHENSSESSQSNQSATQVKANKASNKAKSDAKDDKNKTAIDKEEKSDSNKTKGSTASETKQTAAKTGKNSSRNTTNTSNNKPKTSNKNNSESQSLTQEETKKWIFNHLGSAADFGLDEISADDFTFITSRDDDGLLLVEVRENHDSDHFKGKADPNTAPIVGYFRINKKGQLEKMDSSTGSYQVIASNPNE